MTVVLSWFPSYRANGRLLWLGVGMLLTLYNSQEQLNVHDESLESKMGHIKRYVLFVLILQLYVD